MSQSQWDEQAEDVTPQGSEDPAAESSLESAGDDPEEDEVQPGAEGPVGTGTEGADDALEADRASDAERDALDMADYDDEFGQDEAAAGEQGNRDGDEMVSEGDDASEVTELTGNDDDIDAIGGA